MLFRNELVPADLTERTTGALDVAGGIAAGPGARLTLLHAGVGTMSRKLGILAPCAVLLVE